jgi:hypothetical protein
MTKLTDLWRIHRRTVVSLCIVVPIGLYTKRYAGPAARWVNNSLGGVFYEIFWCLLLFVPLNRGQPWIIATSVLAVTCLLEFLQLWHPPLLECMRSTWIGRTVLGTSFTWLDFPYYLVGCGIGWAWLRGLQSVDRRSCPSCESCQKHKSSTQ